MTTVLDIAVAAVPLLILACAVIAIVVATRRAVAHKPQAKRPRRTLLQHIIRGLYRTAAWIEDVAIAADRGYLAYRCERSTRRLEPENEKFTPLAVNDWAETVGAAVMRSEAAR
jgi:hypothetical protein